MIEVKIKQVNAHYEIYINNEFYCSCDNHREIEEELVNYSAI